MEEAEPPFRFLSDEEFSALGVKDRAIYLALAAQVLERRQVKLREQMMETIKKQQAGEK
jgi:hypothetical protein